MPALDSSVCYFSSTMANAPTLSATAGSLIAILDACLVTGFGQMTATSVTISGGIATANFSSQHAALKYAVVEVAGVTSPAGLNGKRKVTAVTSNSVSFDAFGLADGAATGTITVKLAAAGWEKVFSGTNLAVYRSLDPTSNRKYLRVDDTGTTDARVVAYNAMTDVNTGTDPFPSVALAAGGWYAPKANNTTGTRSWDLWADSKTFYYVENATNANRCCWTFGDLTSQKAGDPDATVIKFGKTSATSPNYKDLLITRNTLDTAGLNIVLSRDYTGLSASVEACMFLPYATANAYAGSSGLTFPNPRDNGVILSRGSIIEGATGQVGTLRGITFPVQSVGTTFTHGALLPQQVDGRDWLALRVSGGNGANGTAFVDVTGPWQ